MTRLSLTDPSELIILANICCMKSRCFDGWPGQFCHKTGQEKSAYLESFLIHFGNLIDFFFRRVHDRLI